jgi:hypothetical protein
MVHLRVEGLNKPQKLAVPTRRIAGRHRKPPPVLDLVNILETATQTTHDVNQSDSDDGPQQGDQLDPSH